MRSIISQNGQTVWDICVQYMGSVEPIFELLKLNPGVRTDITIPSGTVIYLPDIPDNKRIADYYALNEIKPATGVVIANENFVTGKFINLIDSKEIMVAIGVFPISIYYDPNTEKYVTKEISLEGIAIPVHNFLVMSYSGLSSINPTVEVHGFKNGEWDAIPSVNQFAAQQAADITGCSAVKFEAWNGPFDFFGGFVTLIVQSI